MRSFTSRCAGGSGFPRRALKSPGPPALVSDPLTGGDDFGKIFTLMALEARLAQLSARAPAELSAGALSLRPV
jgi:hypothetical protein